jgi:hypothetical protein
MEQIRNFIDLVASGNNAEAKEVVGDMLSSRAFEALESKKQELAANLFGGSIESPTETE